MRNFHLSTEEAWQGSVCPLLGAKGQTAVISPKACHPSHVALGQMGKASKAAPESRGEAAGMPTALGGRCCYLGCGRSSRRSPVPPEPPPSIGAAKGILPFVCPFPARWLSPRLTLPKK